MRFPRRTDSSARFLQLYFIVGILVLGGFWFGYSQYLLVRLSRLWSSYAGNLSQQLENETLLRSRIYAKFMSRATEPSSAGSAELDIIFEEVIKKIDFPVIITDRDGRPISHRNLAEAEPTDSALAALVVEMDTEHEPIPLTVTEGDSVRTLGTIHHGVSNSTRALRELNRSLTESVRSLSLFSVVQLLLLVGFVGIGVWGILVYKRREQEHIWTALAKETAHQLATPLSALSGWVEVLRNDGNHELIAELEQDVGRMREVLDRFSRIGMPPELSSQRLGPVVRHSVEFVRRRAAKTIAFEVDVSDDPPVRVDEVLFAWTLENLLKNSVDAIGSGPGSIEVSLARNGDGRWLEIEVIDTGEGVKVDKVFAAGVTTKQHGWGVGLALAKRIVEDFHRGRLVLKETRPGRTVFAILLPVEQEAG